MKLCQSKLLLSFLLTISSIFYSNNGCCYGFVQSKQSPFLSFPINQQQSLRLKGIYYRPPESRQVWHHEVPQPSPSSTTTVKEEEQHFDQDLKVLPMLNVIPRPKNTNERLRELYSQGRLMRLSTSDTTEFESTWGLVPDVSHRPSILTLAIMTNNAYTSLNNTDSKYWYPLSPPWSVVSSFVEPKGRKKKEKEEM